MNNDSTLERLEQVFSDVFFGELMPPDEMTRTNCSRWDSMGHLNLLLALEQEFGITISDDAAADLDSFAAALQVILGAGATLA
jgi:acyl carrier protein